MRPADRNLGVILVIAFAVRLAYAVGTPAWQSADEYPHYWAAQQIASTGALPQSEPVFPSYEAFQPPLYYVLSAGLLRLAGLPEAAYSEEMVPPPAPLLILRLASVLLGVGTVWAAYQAGQKVWRLGEEAPAMAALFVALLPAFVVVSSSVTNEALATFLSSLFFLTLATPRKEWTARTALAAGVWAGLAVLTKLSGLILLVPLAWRYVQIRTDGGGKRLLPAIAAGFLVPTSLLVLRDVALYGHFPAVNPGLAREYSLSAGHIVWALRNMAGSFVFAAGRIYEIRPPVLVYALTVGPMILLALVGWFRRAGDHCANDLRWPLGASLVTAVALSLLYTLSYPEGTMTSWGKNLYPALTAAAIISVDGWRNLHPASRRSLPLAFLALLAAGSLWGIWELAHLGTGT